MLRACWSGDGLQAPRLSGTERYDEFKTIGKSHDDSNNSHLDWIYDSIKEKSRVAELHRQLPCKQWSSWFMLMYEAAQAWIVVFIAGILIGLNTALISVVTEWLSDLKIGYCSTGWWLNEKFCCWENEDECKYTHLILGCLHAGCLRVTASMTKACGLTM
ncbi:glycerol ethanol, ferric requiring protein [Spiromyces aspiralis]|uniref:Glycerol ethanol, ferric requiring protein n=1 Tax=Spiromyces aspiralis TaxID=68401 RepID=A0ACC1HNN9_9FUNG|nr:glycerol ethanol, ferric requiring protein [Spiromyces aspiralis]